MDFTHAGVESICCTPLPSTPSFSPSPPSLSPSTPALSPSPQTRLDRHGNMLDASVLHKDPKSKKRRKQMLVGKQGEGDTVAGWTRQQGGLGSRGD